MHFLAQTSTPSSDQATAIAAMMGGGFLIFSLIILVVMVAIYWVILGKTGYSPALSLLILIPGIGGLIILIMLVFTEWPIQRELRACRAQLGGGGYAPPGGGYPPTGGYPPPGAPPPGSSITTP
jgi:hypothetical protein